MNPETLAAYFQSVADALPAWVLLLGASVGHGYLFIVALNVFYAWPLPHELMKYTRKVDLLIVMSGPLLFAGLSFRLRRHLLDRRILHCTGL
jgi:hypothetical protein